MSKIVTPFPLISDTDGTALENGYVYIGVGNLDPTTNPIAIYWDQDLTIPAAQPVRTLNGYFSNNGSVGSIYTGAEVYSMTVKDKNLVLVYSTNIVPVFESSSNVKDFGAVGDGVTDDTAAIQAAIDSLTTGGILLFPSGTYLISSALSIIVDSIKLIGEGETNTVIKGSAIMAVGIDMSAASYCSIEMIGIDGNTLIDTGVSIYDAINPQLDRVKVSDVLEDGFLISNVQNCLAKLSGVDGCGLAGFKFESSVALDAGATIKGVTAAMNACYAYAADGDATDVGSINSVQAGVSQIDVLVEEFVEYTNGGAVSVSVTPTALNNLQFSNCSFLEFMSGSVSHQQPNAIRTSVINMINGVAENILTIESIFNGTDHFSGLINVIVTVGGEYGSSAVTGSQNHLLAVNKLGATDTITVISQTGGAPYVTWDLNVTTFEGTVTSTGNRYFYITQLGGLKLTNI